MPQRDYIIWLDSHTYIKVDFVTVRGRLVSFTVRPMVIEETGEVNVARYDTAHGTPHLDVNGRRKGQIIKVWYHDLTLETVLNYAIGDFKGHYENYIAEFARH